MYARVSTYEIPDGRMDDAVTSFRTALEEIGNLDGFSEGFFIVSGEEEKATALTLWTTQTRARGEPDHREPAPQRSGPLDRQRRRERLRVRGRGARARGAELGDGAAWESNPPSRGLHDRTGFEDHRGCLRSCAGAREQFVVAVVARDPVRDCGLFWVAVLTVRKRLGDRPCPSSAVCGAR